MVAFIELPCNLHFAPLGLPARAAGSRRGPSKRVFRLGAMASQESCANGAEGLGLAGRTGRAACFALFCMKSPPWPYGMRGRDDADSPKSLLVGGPIHEHSEGAKGVSRLRLLLVSLD